MERRVQLVTVPGAKGLPTPQLKREFHRKVKDKSYYIQKVSTHMASIREEITRLNRDLNRSVNVSRNYNMLKEDANTLRSELEHHEETLSCINGVLLCHSDHASKTAMETQCKRYRDNNREMTQQLEKLHGKIVRRRERLSRIQRKLECVNEKIQESVGNVPGSGADVLDRYNELKRQKEAHEKDISKIKERFNVNLKIILDNSTKHTYYSLEREYDKLSKKLLELEVQEQSHKREVREHTMEMELEKLKNELECLENEKVQLTVELEKLKERDSFLREQLSEGNAARLRKFVKFLKTTSKTQDLIMENRRKVKELKESIAFSELYTANEQNFEPTTHKQELPDYFRRLSSKLHMLTNLQRMFYGTNIEKLKKQVEEYEREIKRLENIGKNELFERKTSLELQVEELKRTLRDKGTGGNERGRRLQASENYVAFSHFEHTCKNVKELEEAKKIQRKHVEEVSFIAEIYRSRAMGLVQNISGLLQKTYCGGKLSKNVKKQKPVY